MPVSLQRLGPPASQPAGFFLIPRQTAHQTFIFSGYKLGGGATLGALRFALLCLRLLPYEEGL